MENYQVQDKDVEQDKGHHKDNGKEDKGEKRNTTFTRAEAILPFLCSLARSGDLDSRSISHSAYRRLLLLNFHCYYSKRIEITSTLKACAYTHPKPLAFSFRVLKISSLLTEKQKWGCLLNDWCV